MSEECLRRWGKPDKRTENFYEKITKWLDPINDEFEESILLKLLSNFNYYSRYKANEVLIELHTRYLKVEGNDDYTIYTSIKSQNGHINSSQELVIEYKNLNDINSKSTIDDLNSIIKRKTDVYDGIKSIVFVDDIIGTGKTVTDYLKLFIDFLKGKKVYLLVFEVSEEAYDKVMQFGKDNEININITYINKHKKAFCEGYIFNKEDADKARTVLENRELLLWNNNNKYVLGFGTSELLVAFWSNTPNNTLSTFWCENKNLSWTPLFPRKHDPTPKWMNNKFTNYRQKKNNANINLEKDRIAKKG